MSARRQSGFSYFEFAAAVAMLGVLLAVFLGKIAFYEAVAEDIAVTRTKTALQEALVLEVNACKRAQRPLATLAEQNPLDWLERKPQNQLGEVDGGKWQDFPKGNWVFDRRDRTLIYLWNSKANVEKSNASLLKFRIELIYSTPFANDVHSPATPSSAALVQIVTFDDDVARPDHPPRS